jgi:hypothetical protein
MNVEPLTARAGTRRETGFRGSLLKGLWKQSRQLSFGLLAAVAIAGCVTEPQESARVRVGMTRDDLRFFFGEPLRIEVVETGEEIWYYRVIAPTAPIMGGAAWQDAYTGEGGVAIEVSPSEKVQMECPIFLSPEGQVVEPLPEVSIRGR